MPPAGEDVDAAVDPPDGWPPRVRRDPSPRCVPSDDGPEGEAECASEPEGASDPDDATALRPVRNPFPWMAWVPRVRCATVPLAGIHPRGRWRARAAPREHHRRPRIAPQQTRPVTYEIGFV